MQARGIDPLRMSMGDASSAAERMLANAVESGILKRDKFDHGPYFPIA